jgi:uncharacterized SAM-binding protein YcdF (DUF218 family)
MAMDYAFLFKKAISLYVHPMTISFEMIVFGLVLVGFSRRRTREKPGKKMMRLRKWAGDIGIAAIISGTFFLYLCSIKPISDPLIFTLEKHYPPLRLTYENEMSLLNPEFIVVLAGGERSDEDKPVTSRLSSSTLARVIEGVHLSREFPETTILFTGSEVETKAMSDVMEEMGVDPARLMSESESKDTKDHPLKLKPILGESEFLLVTSGYHMPRAMSLFHGQGLEPTPAACDLWVWPRFSETNPYRPENFIPRITSLEKTHYAFHEYMGLTWARLREQTGPLAAKVDGKVESEEKDAGEEEEKPRGDATIEL